MPFGTQRIARPLAAIMKARLFPYDSKVEIIDLPMRVVQDKLREHVQLKSYIPLFKDDRTKTLAGNITKDVWQVLVKTKYRNSFKPEISITFEEIDDSKTKLKFEFRLFKIARIFLVCWSVFAIMWGLFSLYYTEVFDIMLLLIPVGMIGIAFIMTYMGFYMGLDNATDYFNDRIKEIKTAANTR